MAAGECERSRRVGHLHRGTVQIRLILCVIHDTSHQIPTKDDQSLSSSKQILLAVFLSF